MKKILTTLIVLTLGVLLTSCSGGDSKPAGETALNTEALVPARELRDFLKNQISALDSTKPTMCSITINSKDEREVFQEKMGEGFNFIELVDEENSFWFEDSCNAKINCDVVVVSGHFGGSFFGKSKQKLSAKKMEMFSCNSYCEGILKNPKEVFLFGCNTTASKEYDGRTTEEYADILYNEYRDVYTSREMAELHAAFRYSPIGSETQEKMQRVFSNSRIYGFHSKAPYGHHIRPRLNRYFRSIGDYKEHIQNFVIEEENSAWRIAMKGQAIRTVIGSDELESPMCILGGEESDLEKLSWVEGVLLEETHILAYSTEITEFFERLEEQHGVYSRKWPKRVRAKIGSFQFYVGAKKVFDDFLATRFEGILSTQLDILRLGERFFWYNSEESAEIKKNLLDGIFKKNLTFSQKYQICNMNITMEIEAEDLPRRGSLNSATVQALKCLGVRNLGVSLRMLDVLKDNEINQAYFKKSVIELVAELNPQSIEVQRIFVETLNHDNGTLRNTAFRMLEKIQPENEEIRAAVAKYIEENE